MSDKTKIVTPDAPRTLSKPGPLDIGLVAMGTARRIDPDINDRTKKAHRLAMLALQSDRYVQDAEYREATDAVLAFSFPGYSPEIR